MEERRREDARRAEERRREDERRREEERRHNREVESRRFELQMNMWKTMLRPPQP